MATTYRAHKKNFPHRYKNKKEYHIFKFIESVGTEATCVPALINFSIKVM